MLFRSPARDQLQRIGGINAEIERQLAGVGVSRYAQIAGWSGKDVERFDSVLGMPGRIGRENWVEQAQMLGRGGDTAYSREFDRRGGDGTREPRPAKLADAIRDNSGRGSEPTAPRSDIGALRSVRSQAYRTPEAAPAGAADSVGSARVVRSAEPDDLKRIRGIGVLLERKLNSLGITGYGQIANWDTADIDRVSQTLDFKGRVERENWVEQARILASGGATEFSHRFDKGEVETAKPRSS